MKPDTDFKSDSILRMCSPTPYDLDIDEVVHLSVNRVYYINQ